MTHSPIDSQVFRTVLSHYPTGVVVVTATTAEGEHLALVVGTFSSVSMDPPLVSFMPMKSSRTYEQLAACESMCINVLTAEQEEVGRTIARRKQDKLAGLDWFASPSGDPILRDSLAWLDVRLHDTVDAGDHWITLCRVEELAVNNPVAPLLFFQGGYGAFVVPSLVARIDAEIADGVDAAVDSRDELEDLAAEVGGEATLFKTLHDSEMVALATAGGHALAWQPGLGHRLPIIPPIGDTWASSVDDERQQDWLRRAVGADEELLEVYRARLAYCRENGYLLTFAEDAEGQSFDELRAATAEYASSRLTPSQERDIRQRVTEASRPAAYAPRPLDPSGSYDIASIMVPIPDAAGEATMTLRLSALPPGVDGSTVQRWVDLAQRTARDIATP